MAFAKFTKKPKAKPASRSSASGDGLAPDALNAWTGLSARLWHTTRTLPLETWLLPVLTWLGISATKQWLPAPDHNIGAAMAQESAYLATTLVLYLMLVRRTTPHPVPWGVLRWVGVFMLTILCLAAAVFVGTLPGAADEQDPSWGALLAAILLPILFLAPLAAQCPASAAGATWRDGFRAALHRGAWLWAATVFLCLQIAASLIATLLSDGWVAAFGGQGWRGSLWTVWLSVTLTVTFCALISASVWAERGTTNKKS